MSDADRLAEIVKHAPHSFQVIRAQSSLKLTDGQFAALIRENSDRFRPVHFARKNESGERMNPGRPGVRLIGH